MSLVEVLIIVAAVLLGATIKSVTGMGLPLIAIPIISVFAGAETAIAVLAIPNTAHNLVLAVRHRQFRHRTVGLTRLTLAGIVGAAIGATLLRVVPESAIVITLILLVGAYLVLNLHSPLIALDHRRARRWAPATGFFAGILQGGAGISGPIVGTWHHALRLERGAFVLSVATVFSVSGGTQAIVLASTGLLDGRLTVSLVLTAVVLGTVPIGRRLSERLSTPAFDRAVLALLGASLIALLVDLLT